MEEMSKGGTMAKTRDGYTTEYTPGRFMLHPTRRAMQALERAIKEEGNKEKNARRNWRDIALEFFEAGAVHLGYMDIEETTRDAE